MTPRVEYRRELGIHPVKVDLKYVGLKGSPYNIVLILCFHSRIKIVANCVPVLRLMMKYYDLGIGQ